MGLIHFAYKFALQFRACIEIDRTFFLLKRSNRSQRNFPKRFRFLLVFFDNLVDMGGLLILFFPWQILRPHQSSSFVHSLAESSKRSILSKMSWISEKTLSACQEASMGLCSFLCA